jgi:hypothetical protein
LIASTWPLILADPKQYVMTEKGRALWILALMSPVIAEMLSGSSPPLEFFNPFSFMLLLGLYGAGVLLAREISVIWNLGWAGIVVLGVAYGILEEGVAIKSFFDPLWMDLGGLGEYGRYLGTNWVWAVWLTIYHASVSITLPIIIFNIVYPGLRNERLLTGRRFKIVLGILIVDVLVCTLLLNPYVPFLPMYVLSIAAVLGFVLYAKHVPGRFFAPTGAHPTWGPLRFAVLGFLLLLSNFLLAGAFVETGAPPIVPVMLMLAVCMYIALMIKRHLGTEGNLPHKAHFVAGMLSFFVVLGLLLEMGGILGMSAVAVVTALLTIDFVRWSKGKKVLIFRVRRLMHGPTAHTT